MPLRSAAKPTTHEPARGFNAGEARAGNSSLSRAPDTAVNGDAPHGGAMLAFSASPDRECIMATDKPRITVTLEPRVYAALKAFSDGTGQPMSQFVTQVMSQSLPALESLALLVQQAKNAKPEALRQIGDNMERLHRLALKAQGGVEMALDLFTEPPPAGKPRPGGAGAGRRKAPKTGKSAPCPPISNRGGQKPAEGGASGKVTRLRDRRHAG